MNITIVIFVAALGQAPAPTPAPTQTDTAVSPQVQRLPVAPETATLPPLTLDDAIQQALAKNTDLQVAQARLDQAHTLAAKMWANYLPQISLGGSYTRNNIEVTVPFPMEFNVVGNLAVPFDPKTNPGAYQFFTIQKANMWAGQAQVTQALIVPALWPAIRAAYMAQKVAELSTANARREILFAVTQLYYGAVSLKEALAVQHRLLANNLEHEHDARVQYEAGVVLKITLLRSEIDRAKAEEDLLRAQNAYDSACLSLASLLDRDNHFDVVGPADPSLPDNYKSLDKTAETNRLDLAASEVNTRLAETVHNGTWLQYLPSIIGNAAYRDANVQGFSGQYTSWAITAALNWTLWDGGLREATLRETAAKLVEAQANLRATQLKVHDEMAHSLLNLESARANRSKAEEALRLARENMHLVDLNFQNGTAKQLDVSDANTTLAGAELGAIVERLNAQLASLSLLKAAGLFNPEATPVAAKK